MLPTLVCPAVVVSPASRSRRSRRYQLIRPSMPTHSPNDSEALAVWRGDSEAVCEGRVCPAFTALPSSSPPESSPIREPLSPPTLSDLPNVPELFMPISIERKCQSSGDSEMPRAPLLACSRIRGRRQVESLAGPLTQRIHCSYTVHYIYCTSMERIQRRRISLWGSKHGPGIAVRHFIW